MFEKKRILIPGGKLSDWALVNAAHRLNLYVITSGTDVNAPAHKFSDEYVCADYSDREAMLKLAKEKKIDYMCSCANDFGMLSTAYVCEQLGLPGHDSYETTWTLHHKDTLKPLAKKLGLHMPESVCFTSTEEAIDFLKKADKQMIVKPSDNVDSRGVSTPESASEIEIAVEDAFQNSKAKVIMIEPFIKGYYCSTDAMLVNQKVRAFVSDSVVFYPEGSVLGRKFPECNRGNGINKPCPDIKEIAPIVIDDFNKLAKELRLVDGAIHCELLVDENHQPHIFDLHRRMSGFNYPWASWNSAIGFRWEDWLVKAECGMSINEFPEGLIQKNFLHMRNIYAPKNGIIKKMEFDEYLTSHMYPKCNASRFAIYDRFISDCKFEPILRGRGAGAQDQIYFKFDTLEELNYVSSTEKDHFYEHISFEYDE